ncbi:MAG: caspase family protein [Bacteroidetes bacterium]|nr:caspase family protein [Bacteroidota bacterium]
MLHTQTTANKKSQNESYELTIQNCKSVEIDALALTKDKRYLLSTNSIVDETCFWDIKLGKLLRKIGSSGSFLGISDDAKTGLICTKFMAQWYDLETGKLIGKVMTTGFITSAAISPDARYAAVGVYNLGINIIDLKKSRIIKQLKDSSATNILGLSFIKNGTLLSSAESGGNVKLFSTRDWNLSEEINMNSFLQNIVFDDNAKFCFYNEGSDSVFLFDLEKKNIANRFQTNESFFKMALSITTNGLIGVAGSDEGKINVWNLKENFTMNSIDGHQKKVTAIVISNDGKLLVSGGSDNCIKLWDVEQKKQIKTLTPTENLIRNICLIKDKNRLIYTFNNVINILELTTGNLIKTYTIPITKLAAGLTNDETNSISQVESTDDGNYILLSTKTNFSILETKTGKVIKTLNVTKPFSVTPDLKYGLFYSSASQQFQFINLVSSKVISHINPKTDYINALKISKDGKYAYTAYKDNAFVMWDLQSGQIKKAFTTKESGVITDIEISKDEQNISICRLGGIVESWSLTDAKHLYFKNPSISETVSNSNLDKVNISEDFKQVAVGLGLTISCISSSADFKWLLFGKLRGGVSLFNTTTMLETSYDLGNSSVRSVCISNNGKYGYALLDNNEIRFFDFEQKKQVATFISTGEKDFVKLLSDGFFSSTKLGLSQLGYVKGLKYFGIEQLDVKYNRPDKVLEALGNTDTALINSYRKAYYKRIKKLGIDTTQFKDGYSVPEADFVNRDSIEYEQKNSQLKLHIHAIDSTYKLDRFNIWINEAPLFGLRGLSLKAKDRNEFDTTIIIKLSQGENSIETSIINANGTESYKMPLYVKFTPETGKVYTPKLHFIGIGMNEFANNKYNLSWSVKDIRDFSVKLKNKYENDIEIDTLFNENVSTEKVKALKQKLLASNINDKVIVAYSGHGMLSKNYDYYLSTFNVNFDKPEENGLAYDELENLLDSIPARQKLMLIDACHSGELDKEELQKLQAIATSMDSTSNKSIKTKGIKIFVDSSHKTIGIKNSFELMQNLFVNVGKGTGATIISAAAGTQFALERGDLKNGVFTYSILELFEKNKTITVSELKKYVNQRVAEITKGAQQPTSRTETLQNDWRVW